MFLRTMTIWTCGVFRSTGLVLLVSFLVMMSATAQTVADLTVDEFAKSIVMPNIQVLDVRTDAEFRSGHLQQSLWADWTNPTQFAERTASLDKSKPVYTYCLSGGRSGAAAKWLRDHGYIVYNMKGGIVDWKKANMPVEAAAVVKQMDANEYAALIPNDKIVLVDFGAEWCPPCKKMLPVLDALTSDKTLSFSLVKIDGGEQIQLMKQMNIQALPTFIVYKNGKEVWRKTGIVEASEFKSKLK